MEPPLCLRSLLSRLPSITIRIGITTEREERVRSVGSSWPVRAAWPPPGLDSGSHRAHRPHWSLAAHYVLCRYGLGMAE